MKRILKIAALSLVIALGCSLPNPVYAQYDQYDPNDQYDGNDQYDNDREVDYQTFYDELSPHGRWVDYPGQGYVWIPDAGPDFRPYSTKGHWVYSENYEWMWVSDYDWGWAPFHYGRWDQDPSYGWYWVPGYEWSPAWVAWRDGGDYYGWAPIRPGINISVNFNIGGYAPPVDFWCFAPRRYISSPRIYDYCVPYRQNVTIISYTTIISNNYSYGGNYGFRAGPRRYDAERYCGVINPVRFRPSYQPGRSTFRNNEVSIYRPNVRRDVNRNVAPRSFERYDRNNSGNSNNGFRRNNDVVRNNNSNAPVRREGNTPDNRDRIERRNDTRQPQNNNGNTNPGNRRFERNDNNQPNGERVINPSDRPVRNTNPGGNTEPRKFERRENNNGNTNNPVRQPEVRKNENKPQRQQMERKVEPRQQQSQPQQPRQFERKQAEPRPQQQQQPRPQQQQQPRQIERRQAEPRPQQQQQPRQIERRDNGNSQGGGSGKRSRF